MFGLSVNGASFLATVLATLGVAVICIYASVRCFRLEATLAGIGLLAVIPLWLITQVVVIAVFDAIEIDGFIKRENHLQYALTPVLNVAAAILVWYWARRIVARAASSPAGGRSQPVRGEAGALLAWFLDARNLAGLALIVIGAATMPFFVLSGVLFIVGGVSLIMRVNLWRR